MKAERLCRCGGVSVEVAHLRSDGRDDGRQQRNASDGGSQHLCAEVEGAVQSCAFAHTDIYENFSLGLVPTRIGVEP